MGHIGLSPQKNIDFYYHHCSYYRQK